MRKTMVEQIQPAELDRKLKAGEPVYLVDVRQEMEYDHCRLPGATLVPLHELAFRLGELDPPDGAAIVVYCHHGVRSLSGAAILQHAGFGPVASLAGGIEAWSLLIDPKVPRY